MNEMRIDLEGGTALEPGTEIAGTAYWTFAESPTSVHVRLFWYTEGKGDRDLSVIDESSVEAHAPVGEIPFRFRVPEGPYSFSGKLISLIWAIEAVAEPAGATGRVELTVGPGGREARIDSGATSAEMSGD